MNMSYAQRAWLQTSILMLVFIPIVLVAMQLDSRALYGISIWIKPLKFHISAALHLLTFALLIHYLPVKTRNALWLTILAGVSVAAMIVEVMIIDFQAARGVASHFNYNSQFDGMLYATMGVAALLLSAPALILGIRFMVADLSDKLTPGLKLGASLGLTFGFFLTLGIAGYLSMSQTGHWIDAPNTDVGGMPVTGWNREGGDLRVPHFFATHMMQILPLAGWLLDKAFLNRKQNQKHKIYIGVFGVAVLSISVTVATLFQALAGKSFL